MAKFRVCTGDYGDTAIEKRVLQPIGVEVVDVEVVYEHGMVLTQAN